MGYYYNIAVAMGDLGALSLSAELGRRRLGEGGTWLGNLTFGIIQIIGGSMGS